jgi:hypothetical protein
LNLPVLGWVRGYDRAWLSKDLVGGLGHVVGQHDLDPRDVHRFGVETQLASLMARD